MRDLEDLWGKKVNVRGYANNQVKRSRNNNAYVLVTNVLVSCENITKKIDHIWTKIELVESHAVNFYASVTIYQRENGYCDYGFKNEINLITY